MIKEMKNPKVICSIIGVLIAIAILVLQFVPYWTFEQEVDYEMTTKTASINEYVWFPTHNDGALELFNKDMSPVGYSVQEFEEICISVNDIALPVVLQFITAIALIALCIWRPKLAVVGLVAIVCGGMGLFGNIASMAAFSLNQPLWITNIVLSALMLIVGILKLFGKQIFKNA